MGEGGTTVNSRCVSRFSPPYILRQSLTRNLELSDLPRLSGQQVPGMVLFLYCQDLGYQHVPLCPAFIWVLGIQTQSSCFCGKILTQWTISLALWSFKSLIWLPLTHEPAMPWRCPGLSCGAAAFNGFCITQGGSLHCCWSLISTSVLYGLAVYLCSPMPMTVSVNTKHTGGAHILYYLTILGLFCPFQLQLKLGLAMLGKYSTTGHSPRCWLLRDSLPL